MSFTPFLPASHLVQIHAAAALSALLLGSYQMLARKGTKYHRKVGWVWVASMTLVTVSSLGIVASRPLIGPFGWIHAVSALTLAILPFAVMHARQGRTASHRRSMTGLFVGGLVVTGLFTLIPGRLMHRVIFGG